MQLPWLVVEAALEKQAVVVALVADGAAVEAQGRLDCGLVHVVEMGRGFVEGEDRGVFEERSGPADPLALSA